MKITYFYKYRDPKTDRMQYFTITNNRHSDAPNYNEDITSFLERDGKSIKVKYVFPEPNGHGIVIIYEEIKPETL